MSGSQEIGKGGGLGVSPPEATKFQRIKTGVGGGRLGIIL